MSITRDELQRRLKDQLGAMVRVDRRPDGQLMPATGFRFPDGDTFPIYLSATPGGIRLSDRGDTLMRISYEEDLDAFLAGSRGSLVERILREERVDQDRGVFYVAAPVDEMADALFRYGRAVTRIHGLARSQRMPAR